MTHIEQRFGPAAEWTSVNPVLHSGEAGHESDTGKWKLGDGVTAWTGLLYKGGVDSVAGKTGVVVLAPADVPGVAPLNNPAFTGSPTAPTKATSDDSTNIATTAFVKDVLDAQSAAFTAAINAAVAAAKLALFPIGAIYHGGENPANPSTFIGGTWARYANGRVLVGLDEVSGDIFNDIGEEGGAKTVTLTAAQSGLRGHNHGQDAHGHGITQTPHSHAELYPDTFVQVVGTPGAVANSTAPTINGFSQPEVANVSVNNATATNQAVADANATTAHDNTQPYKVVYIWKRTG